MNNQQEEPQKRKIGAREYLRMAEVGLLPEHGVELIAGEIYELPPISEPEAQTHSNVTARLIRSLPKSANFVVRSRAAVNAGEWTRPEPDVAVVRPESLSADEPPSNAILLVEISKATLRYDQTVKASLYASLGVPDYWIVNLIDNQVEVYRQPIERAGAQFGHDYASRQIYLRGQSVALLEAPEVSIEVDAMLP